MNIEKVINILDVIIDDVHPIPNPVLSKAKLAAAIVYKGKIVAIGYNQEKTHPFAFEYQKNEHCAFLHAETDVIMKAKKKLSEKELSKATLFVVRTKNDINKNKTFAIAKPCAGCQRCIEDHNIKTVIYTNNSEQNEINYSVVNRRK